MHSHDVYQRATKKRSIGLEIANATVMVILAIIYMALAIINYEVAEAWWGPFAITECLLAIWNLATYWEKAKQRDRGRSNGRRYGK